MMNDRASSNKQPILEKGVFSSLSTLALYSHGERKTKSTVPQKFTKTPVRVRPEGLGRQVSPMRTERLLETSKSSPMRQKRLEENSKLSEENKKLQSMIRSLSSQLNSEKKKSHSLEAQLKDLQSKVSDSASLTLRLERAQKTIDDLQSSHKKLVEKSQTSASEINDYKSLIVNASIHIETLANVVIDVVDNIVKPLLESVEGNNSELIENLQGVIIEEFLKIKEDTNIDLREQIHKAKEWDKNKDLPKQIQITDDNDIFANRYIQESDQDEQDDQLPHDTHNLSFSHEQAIALYKFEGEQENDLTFRKGEIIEILEKDSSGWWLGRVGQREGSFPYNYVQIM